MKDIVLQSCPGQIKTKEMAEHQPIRICVGSSGKVANEEYSEKHLGNHI